MAVNFTGKPQAPAQAEQPQAEQPVPAQPGAVSPTTHTIGPAQGGTVNPFMSGQEAQAAIAQDKKRAEERREGVFRFFLPAGGKATVTFLTGAIDSSTGRLDFPTAWEHNLRVNGKWFNHHICTAQIEGECPGCEHTQGGEQAYLAHYAWIIDHSEFKTKKGVVMRNQPRLLVAKAKSRAQFEDIAASYGGLAFRTFDVTRSTAEDAAIGNNWMCQGAVTQEELVQGMLALGSTQEEIEKALVVPPVTTWVPYKKAVELRAMGIGAPAGQAPAGSPTTGTTNMGGAGPAGTLESQL